LECSFLFTNDRKHRGKNKNLKKKREEKKDEKKNYNNF
jgi:hypothetical protein